MVFAAVVAVVALLAVHLWRQRGRMRLSPFAGVPMACPGVPVLGHVLSLGEERIAGTKALCVDAADPDTGLAAMYLFDKPLLSVLDADDARAVFSATTHREPQWLVQKHLDAMLGPNALVSLMGEPWRFHRKIIAGAFAPRHLQAMASDMSTVGSRLVNLFAGLGAEPGIGDVEVVGELKKATLDVIGLSAFGYSFDCISQPGTNPVAEAFSLMLKENDTRIFGNPLLPSNFFYSLPTARNRAHAKAVKAVRGALQKVLDSKRAEIADGTNMHDDLLSVILSKHGGDDEAEPRQDDSTLIDNLLTFFFGGYDTTSVALSFALYEVAARPEVEAKMLQEIDEVVGPDSLPSFEDVQRLVYCTAVFKETLRLYPPAPLSARNTTAPLSIAGVNIPVGTLIWIPIWWVHRCAKNWDRPEAFEPERFLQTSPAGPSNGGSANTERAWFPFSSGRRSCVGQKFAMLEGTILLSVLVRDLEFRRTARTNVEPVSSGFVTCSKEGVRLAVRRRKCPAE